MRPFVRWPALVLGKLLRMYKRYLSPAIGFACRFEPTCACYAEEAISRYGVIRGGALAAWRLFRCHPFAKSGLDPVPERLAAVRRNSRRFK